MSGTIITQKQIAKSFKDLMKTKSLQQISVSQIMDTAGIRRQTFYDYFQDKYELTTWIYKQEFKEYIGDYIGYDPILKVLERFLVYLKDNKEFYHSALSYHDQNAFEEVLLKQLNEFIYQMLTLKDDLNKKKSVDTYQTLSKYISYSLTGMIHDWIFNGCDQDVSELVTEIELIVDHLKL